MDSKEDVKHANSSATDTDLVKPAGADPSSASLKLKKKKECGVLHAQLMEAIGGLETTSKKSSDSGCFMSTEACPALEKTMIKMKGSVLILLLLFFFVFLFS